MPLFSVTLELSPTADESVEHYPVDTAKEEPAWIAGTVKLESQESSIAWDESAYAVGSKRMTIGWDESVYAIKPKYISCVN